MIALGGELDIHPNMPKPVLIIPQGPLVLVWLLALGLPSGEVSSEAPFLGISQQHPGGPLGILLGYSFVGMRIRSNIINCLF